MDKEIIVGMWCLFNSTTDVLTLQQEFLLQRSDITSMVYINEAVWSTVFVILIDLSSGTCITPSAHQKIRVLVCANHAGNGMSSLA